MLESPMLSMPRFQCWCLLSAIFVLGTWAQADSKFECPASKDYQRVHRFNGYVVKMLPGPKNSEYRCRGTVTPPNGVRQTVAREWAMSLDAVSGTDLNGDGMPEVVFDGSSGGAGCCYVYWIVSLTKKPTVLREIRNQLPLVFRKREEGGTEIRTGEGSFDLFLLSHEDAVIPQLILRLEGSKLTDISAQYQKEYDEEIAKARNGLTAADLEKFRQSNYNQKMFIDQLPTVKRVLTIVLNYLYSGRETQAWQALDELWPASDEQRVKGLILERRARGLVGQMVDPAVKPQP
jgi:hypothetical protein